MGSGDSSLCFRQAPIHLYLLYWSFLHFYQLCTLAKLNCIGCKWVDQICIFITHYILQVADLLILWPKLNSRCSYIPVNLRLCHVVTKRPVMFMLHTQNITTVFVYLKHSGQTQGIFSLGWALQNFGLFRSCISNYLRVINEKCERQLSC